jgi:hypothetical protein
LTTGIIINPLEIIYTRQITDALLPDHSKRNYKNLVDAIIQVNNESVFKRGALANGISLGLLWGIATPIYDFLKEYYYYFFGVAHWLRPAVLAPSVFIASYLSIPFDNIKTRLHTMTRLPDGRLPYNGLVDCMKKIIAFECRLYTYSNFHAFHNGFIPYFLKNYFAILTGIYISDLAFEKNYQEGELVESGSFYRSPYVKNILHDNINRHEILENAKSLNYNTTYFVNNDKTVSFKI